MSDARNAILGRLRAAGDIAKSALPAEDFTVVASRGWSPEAKLTRLRAAMEAVHTEFLDARSGDWVAMLRDWLVQEALPSLIYAPNTPLGAHLAAGWPGEPPLIPYDKAMNDWKPELFATQGAGITATRGGIAETGSLILWTDADQPRTLSLVPPVHIAVLDVNQLHDTMWQAMQDQGWAAELPTNLLLVSGPSKTADIEQTLAYGVHGPKRLLVVLV
ncbi:MAG TPA: lactate utilization protein [Patescibacteria group bacterium]|nr:lactate utilization protein [Patescibacteria group bacterium]